MNVVFMGTPEFAVESLEYIVKDGINVSCVVTQPDKPKGRGSKLSFSPVKEKALEFGIPVVQPVNIKRDTNFINKLKSMNIDVIIVVAFGQILTHEILSIPRYGCINVHASLLPKLRGAAPINWSIINGSNETGVTTMYMDAGLDTGDMLMKAVTPIENDETAGELYDRLKVIGAEVLIKTLKALENGELKRIPQEHSKYTYAPMLDKDTGKIIWDRKSSEIKNLVRGTNPWPVSYSQLNNIRLKLWKVDLCQSISERGLPGYVWKVDKDGIYVYTGDGSIIIKEVQGENGKKISAYSYTLGHPVKIGDIFK